MKILDRTGGLSYTTWRSLYNNRHEKTGRSPRKQRGSLVQLKSCPVNIVGSTRVSTAINQVYTTAFGIHTKCI